MCFYNALSLLKVCIHGSKGVWNGVNSDTMAVCECFCVFFFAVGMFHRKRFLADDVLKQASRMTRVDLKLQHLNEVCFPDVKPSVADCLFPFIAH